MANVAASPQAGRYQAIHTEKSASVNLASGTGVLATFPVVHESIEILEIGFVYAADSGTVTPPPVVAIKKTTSAAAAAILFTGAQIGLATDLQGPSISKLSLDQAAADPSGGFAKANFPAAVEGNLITFDQTTQGVGGTQSGYLYYKFRERP